MTLEQFKDAEILNQKIRELKYRLDGINKADKEIEFGKVNLHQDLPNGGISKTLYGIIKNILKADYESRIQELEKQFKDL